MQHNKFQASLSQVVLKKLFEYFSMYFYGLIVVVALLFYVHGKHLRSCRDGQLT